MHAVEEQPVEYSSSHVFEDLRSTSQEYNRVSGEQIDLYAQDKHITVTVRGLGPAPSSGRGRIGETCSWCVYSSLLARGCFS